MLVKFGPNLDSNFFYFYFFFFWGGGGVVNVFIIIMKLYYYSLEGWKSTQCGLIRACALIRLNMVEFRMMYQAQRRVHRYESVFENCFSFFLNKTYVVGTQNVLTDG